MCFFSTRSLAHEFVKKRDVTDFGFEVISLKSDLLNFITEMMAKTALLGVGGVGKSSLTIQVCVEGEILLQPRSSSSGAVVAIAVRLNLSPSK